VANLENGLGKKRTHMEMGAVEGTGAFDETGFETGAGG